MTGKAEDFESLGDPGHQAFERDLAQGEYEFARSRFVRTVTGTDVSRVVEQAARQRTKLIEEIENLRRVARDRHEAALADARAYGSILPHRVGRTWMQPPAALEKLGNFYGSERFYKRALKSAKEYQEARDLFVKRRQQLEALEADLRQQLEDREAALMRQLESPRSFQTALQRDPLLNSAYQKLKALRVDLADTKSVDAADVP